MSRSVKSKTTPPMRQLTMNSMFVVPFLMVALLSLNFSIRQPSCPMGCAVGGKVMDACSCTSECRQCHGHHPLITGRLPAMCCDSGVCHIDNLTVSSLSGNGGMTYLYSRIFAYIPPFPPKPFREFKTASSLFLLGVQKDRPPEAS